MTDTPFDEIALARALLARLAPDANAELLATALLAEVEAAAELVDTAVPDVDLALPERELRRVRAQLALGASARTLQHAINNPLTALLAEAQLLELEPMSQEQQEAVARIVVLIRRLIKFTRRLDVPPVGAVPEQAGSTTSRAQES
jgi:nitrogen-specific signal transduction histidine kinase